MNLVIVESPAKAKTISKYLGKGYTVKSSIGHVRDLPKKNADAINIEKGFRAKYEINEDKKKVISELKSLSRKAQRVFLATDPDREGEAIAWHIAKVLDLKSPERVTFHEITKEAVLEAIEKPKRIDQNLRRAQEARRVLDRLVGYDLSGLIWKKVRYGLSAGRVQSPALRIIMEREREIQAFKPEKFWIISAEFETQNSENEESKNKNKNKKEKLTLLCEEKPKDKKEVTRIEKIAKKESWKILDVKETRTQKNPRPPFITSTLQQAASTYLGYAPSRTMALAQRLYEAGLITYMRTDSTNLSDSAKKQIAGFVKNELGEKYYAPRNFARKSKNAQEAHEAIRPTKFALKGAGQNSDQKKLYELIWQRAVASQMAAAEILRTKISANVEKGQIPNFSVTGSRILFDGFLKIDRFSKSENNEVPKLEKDDPLKLKDITSEEKETTPPPRYSEAGLIKELEKRGIGRPSTYASILKTLKDREYVIKEGKTLKPTDTGEVVSDFLEGNFEKYISDSFTAQMEDDLDKIAQGDKKYEKTLKDFYSPFSKEVQEKEKNKKKATDLGKADPKFKCPKCGAAMKIKLGKNGKFLSCSKFPKCDGALTIEGKKMAEPKKIGEKCPDCGGDLIQREGRFGKFISCGNYPKCKFIKQDPKEAEKAKTGVKCPQCQKGEIMEKHGRFGKFYACSNYPQCRFAIRAKPTGKICQYKRLDRGGQKCGALMMEGTKTIPERCSDKTCPNHRPDKLK